MSETEFRLQSEETPATEAEIELPSEDIPSTGDILAPEDIPASADIPATETKFRLRPDDAPVAETPVVEETPVHGSAVLGPEKRNCPSCNQENEIAREFCWACYTKLGDSKAENGAGSQPEHGTPPEQGLPAAQSSPPETVRPQETRRGEDVLVDYGPSVKLAYNPSGQKGKTFTLLLHGATGVLVGLFKAALVLAAAVVVNIIHNLLPVFFFVLPLVIVGLMLIAPGVVGMAVGDNVSKGVLGSKCRVPAQAGFIALLSTVGGLVLFVMIAQSFTTPGESFLYDKLLWFVRLMVGGSVSFDWLAEPEAIGSAYEGIIFVLLGLSAVVGAGIGYHTASETVRSVPFCERCGKHLEPEALWCLPPVQGPRAVQAFQSLNYKEIAQLPTCSMFENFISVEVWSCTCDSKSILELVGHGVEPPEEDGDEPTIQAPVRIFSRPLSPDQLSQIKA